jgi:hypothetical protein
MIWLYLMDSILCAFPTLSIGRLCGWVVMPVALAAAAAADLQSCTLPLLSMYAM